MFFRLESGRERQCTNSRELAFRLSIKTLTRSYTQMTCSRNFWVFELAKYTGVRLKDGYSISLGVTHR